MIIGPVSNPAFGKRRTQDHDTNRTSGRLPYRCPDRDRDFFTVGERSRGWTEEAPNLVLESCNAA